MHQTELESVTPVRKFCFHWQLAWLLVSTIMQKMLDGLQQNNSQKMVNVPKEMLLNTGEHPGFPLQANIYVGPD